MTGEPGKPGPMGIYKPGFNTYATKQSNLTFGGKTYNTYMDLCKDIKDDKDKIVGFLKQKDKELKKYQDSDVDYKKRKIEDIIDTNCPLVLQDFLEYQMQYPV